MEIKFQGQYDKATFFKAVRLANKPVGSPKWLLGFMALFALATLILLLYRSAKISDWSSNAILLGIATVMFLLVGGIFLQPYFVARKMWANQGTRRLLKGQITKRGVEYQLDEGRNEIPWERFNRIRMEKDLITFVRKDGLLLIFPRRFFKRESDWRNFVKLASNKMPSN